MMMGLIFNINYDFFFSNLTRGDSKVNNDNSSYYYMYDVVVRQVSMLHGLL